MIWLLWCCTPGAARRLGLFNICTNSRQAPYYLHALSNVQITDLAQNVRLGHWKLFLSLVCRPASLCTEDKLDLECEAGLPKAFYHWYALIRGQPHICELRTDDRLNQRPDCEAGPPKACFHWYALIPGQTHTWMVRIDDKFDIEYEAWPLKAFYHWYALISGQPHICELCIENRLDLECEAGPLKASFTSMYRFQASLTLEWYIQTTDLT